MRSIIITLVAFLLLCALMMFNYNYINNTAEQLARLADALDFSDKESCRTTLDKINSLWKKSSLVFSLTVSFREIDYMGETLLSLSSAFDSANKTEFDRYRSLLIDAIDGVSRLEKISIINIL